MMIKYFSLVVRKFLLGMAMLLPALSHAIDLNPFDVVAPPPDLNFVSLAYQNTEARGFFSNGAKSNTDPIYEVNQVQFRYARSYEVAGYTGISYIQLPVGSVRTSGSLANLPGTSGVGDITLATAFWPYSNKLTRTYFGLAGYLFLPTGNYSNEQTFNIGANRYVGDVQVAFQTSLVGKLDGMIGLDAMWFAPNKEFGPKANQLGQKPLYTAQIGPSYQFNEMFSVAATYLYVLGGETSINGLNSQNEIQSQRYLLSAAMSLPVGRFTVQYGSDLKTTNGYGESRRILLRYSKAF